MKIDTAFGDRGATVIAYYDVDGLRHYLFVSGSHSAGANVARHDECTVIEVGEPFEKVGTHSVSGVYADPAVMSADLWNRLVEHEEGAVAGLFERIREK